MLIVYSALTLGGVETFFVRLVKERSRRGLTTKVLLLQSPERNNSELLSELSRHAEVWFRQDVFYDIPILGSRTQLLLPTKINALRRLFEGVEHVHVASGHHALLANILVGKARSGASLTVGFYHSLEFAWAAPLPHFEKINRDFVLRFLPKKNLLLFSDSIIGFYSRYCGVDLRGANTFRLGVIGRTSSCIAEPKSYAGSYPLKICSVGRLVDFKTYNLWMLDVVASLRDDGISAIYDVYGDGPLQPKMQERIEALQLQDVVMLKGAFDYSMFDQLVSTYDVFIGSGTAIIQASSLGVCSIVGIESVREPISYGFFSDCADFDYNLGTLGLETHSVKALLKNFSLLSVADKNALSSAHRSKMKQFEIEACVDEIEALAAAKYDTNYSFSRVRYVASYLFTLLRYKLKGESFYDKTRQPLQLSESTGEVVAKLADTTDSTARRRDRGAK